jgi:hypothetical protein
MTTLRALKKLLLGETWLLPLGIAAAVAVTGLLVRGGAASARLGGFVLLLGVLAVLALSVALTPWYALDAYLPNGWDATWWARIAAVTALAGIVALRTHHDREAAALAALALACVAFRTAVVPNFGFAFDGLTVPVERRWGLYLALAAGVVAFAAALRVLRRSAA